MFSDTQLKRCSRGDKCVTPNGPALPITEFNKVKNREGVYHHRCCSCTKEVYQQNRDTKQKQWQEYRQQQNIDSIKNNEEFYWKAYHCAYGLIYRQQNPEIMKAATHRRRARKQDLPDTLTAQDWLNCLEYWNHRCVVCDRPKGLFHTLAMDHWVPLTDPRHDNPGTVPENIIPLCHGIGGCNNSKHNTDPVVWLERKLGKKQAAEKLAEIEAYFNFVCELSQNDSY